MPSKPTIIAAIPSARGLWTSCAPSSEPRFFGDAERVTIMPAEIEMSSAGICSSSP